MCLAMALRMGESCLSESPCLTGESAGVGGHAGSGRGRGGCGGGGGGGGGLGRGGGGCGGGLDVRARDAAALAGTGDGGDVHVQLACQATYGRRHADVAGHGDRRAAGRGRCDGGRGGGWRRCGGRRGGLRLDGLRLGRSRRFGRRGGLFGSDSVGVGSCGGSGSVGSRSGSGSGGSLSGSGSFHLRDGRIVGDRVALAHEDLRQRALEGRRHLGVDLVGHDLHQGVADADVVAHALEPLPDGALFDAFTELGHGHLGHESTPGKFVRWIVVGTTSIKAVHDSGRPGSGPASTPTEPDSSALLSLAVAPG